jgi:hypothetical protein
MNYYVEDAIDVLKNVKNNPYGIKDTPHVFNRSKLRDVDLNCINNYIGQGLLVGIEKSLNERGIFRLLYEHAKSFDLSIVINILNENEILIITIVEKKISRRNHSGN